MNSGPNAQHCRLADILTHAYRHQYGRGAASPRRTTTTNASAQLEATAARHLTAEQRRLFELHHLHHQSIREIAREFDKTKDAVKPDVYRARHVLVAP